MEEQTNQAQQMSQQPIMSPVHAPHLHTIITILIGITMFCIGIMMGYLLFANKNLQDLQISQPDKQQVKVQPTSIEQSKNSCKNYGGIPLVEYLPKYYVKQKENIASIAATQLGSASRSNEIIQLNRTLYPDLYTKDSYPELDSELLLPPSTIKRSSGNLEIISGKITILGDSLGISFGGSNSGAIYIPKGLYGHLADIDKFKLGDCIILIQDKGLGEYIYISLQ